MTETAAAPARILLIEDAASDALLLRIALEEGGFQLAAFERVDRLDDLQQALEGGLWDAVISDYSLPRLTIFDALEAVQAVDADLPFIVVSGVIVDEMAVAAMKAGAHDYIMKDNLARLAPAIRREMGEAHNRRERRRAVAALQRRDEILTALSFAGEQLLRATAWEEELHRVLDRLGAATAMERVYVMQVEGIETGRSWQIRRVAAWEAPDAQLPPLLDGRPLTVADGGTFSTLYHQLSAPQPVLLKGEQASLGLCAVAEDHPTTTTVLLAIIVHDRLWGVMGFDSTEAARTLTAGELDALRIAANIVGAVLQDRLVRRALRVERASLAGRVAARTAELEKANEALARAARLRDEFLANMRHELRTPLNAVLGKSEVLLDEPFGPLNPRQRAAVQTIEDSGNRLLELINDLLDLSKIEAGRLQIYPGRVALQEICAAAGHAMRRAAEKKGVSLSIGGADPALTVWTDELRIKQVLNNLLSNAIKFTPAGGQVGIEVDAAAGSDTVAITVWDNGVGIAPDIQEQLFQPFVQADASLTRAHAGTGLGLALVARLLEKMNGTIAVDSAPGAGSRFTVRLPRRAPDAARAGTAPLPSMAPGASPALGRRTRVLVAEDNAASRDTLSEYLTYCGYEVQAVENGKDALEAATAAPPGAILMDVRLPLLNGIDAMREMRRNPRLRQTPIIAITGLAGPQERERCLDAGATAYLTKPVQLRQVAALLQELLAGGNGLEDLTPS